MSKIHIQRGDTLHALCGRKLRIDRVFSQADYVNNPDPDVSMQRVALAEGFRVMHQRRA